MICPMCIANAAMAVAGVTASGGGTAITATILRRKRGMKRKAEARLLESASRRPQETEGVEEPSGGIVK
jgi:hypothetical protein